NIYMFDSNGLVSRDRAGIEAYKLPFARETGGLSMAEALGGADVFLGLSRGNILTGPMIAKMNPSPIVFALANPDTEIPYEEAQAARLDVILATGRSDYPNQVNNVLGFPYIFRGSLDVRARTINEPMKLAAVHALAAMAREPVPDMVQLAYNDLGMH